VLDLVEKILNSKKVNYKTLGGFLTPLKDSLFQQESTINVFIDIPSVVNQLYNPTNIKHLAGGVLNKKDKYMIASSLLNMIGHYRHYFATRFCCYTNIFFMYNSSIDKNIRDNLNPAYKLEYYDKRLHLDNSVFSDINIILKDNYKVMKIIMDYLPHCYFIDSSYCDYRCIFPFIIKQEEFKDNTNVIISSDKLMYQNTLYGDTIIVEPKGVNSDLITYGIIIKAVAGKSKNVEKHPEYLDINPENIILIDSLISHPKLNTKGVKNLSYISTLKMLNKHHININEPILNPDNLDDIFTDIKEVKDNLDEIKTNFKIYNNAYLANIYNKDLEIIFESCNKYIEELDELRKINEKFFSKHPLNLEFYFNGEID